MKKIVLIITIVLLSVSLLSTAGYFAWQYFKSDGEENGVKIGDTITFGSYEQDGNTTNGNEAIEWIVLDKKDGKLLIISKQVLECVKYNQQFTYTSWFESDLRSFLTYDFYKAAFSEEEKDKIAKVYNKNEGNEEYHIGAVVDSYDDIFCLSISEAEKYFKSDEERKATATKYASTKSLWQMTAGGSAWWWLRNPGNTTRYAANVSRSGAVDVNGEHVNSSFVGVRPAMWIEY